LPVNRRWGFPFDGNFVELLTGLGGVIRLKSAALTGQSAGTPIKTKPQANFFVRQRTDRAEPDPQYWEFY
jgi:hypothetical protein